MSVVFYKDSGEEFKCSVKIEGTEYSKTKTRLILEFSDKTLMFPGTIKKGKVNIKVPALSEIDESNGKATLEVIADSTYFEAWTSKFDLKRKKNIQISEVTIGSESSAIIVEDISVENEEVIHVEPPKASTKKRTIFKETCSNKNKKLVTKLFKRFKKLNESDSRTTKQELKEFKPTKMVQKWANTVFINSNSSTAKFCMMKVQSL